MPSPILARADALMHRRWQNANDADDVPVLTDTIECTDEPLLQEMEPGGTIELAQPPGESSTTSPFDAPLDSALRDILAHELARRLEQRLLTELPNLIEATVRDFLAEQKMIAALQPRD